MFYSSLNTLLATTHPASVPPENHVIPLKSPNPTPSQRLVPKLDTQLEIEEIKRHESVDNISLELVFLKMPHPQPNPRVLLETNPKHYPKKNLFIQKGLCKNAPLKFSTLRKVECFIAF